MDPSVIGTKYDKIAQWWHNQHFNSTYGIPQFRKAIGFAAEGGRALDVGCGSGGRFVRILQDKGFSITGIDVSEEMIKLASTNHPAHKFMHKDICTWESEEEFDFIVAWDSIFHLPFGRQKPVISKLCSLLAKKGILIYTFGNECGEHTDQWNHDTFFYSSIGINENMQILMDNGLTILHLELDQYPEKHVYTIATKPLQSATPDKPVSATLAVQRDQREMEIRRFKEGEEVEIWRLFYNTIHNVNISDYDKNQIEAWAPEDFDINLAIEIFREIKPFVAIKDGRIVGYAVIQPDGYIDHFFCHHEFQGHGVGRALFSILKKQARNNGILSMYSNVSITARPFFEAMGFSVEKEQLIPMRGQELKNYRMVRKHDHS